MRNTKKLSQLMMAGALVATLSGCEGAFTNIQSGSSSPARTHEILGTVGVKNVSQVAMAMSTVTGVPITSSYAVGAATTTLAAQAESIRPLLSTDGKVEDMNASMLLAITGMAGGFCRAFLEVEASQANAGMRKAHASVTFPSGPSALTDEQAEQVIEQYAKLFWRREPNDDELKILKIAIMEAKSGQAVPANTAAARTAATKELLLVPCAAMLSSPEFVRS